MKNKLISFAFASLFVFSAAAETVVSPNGEVKLDFNVKDGVPYYALTYKSTPVVKESRMGFVLTEQGSMDSGFEIAATDTTSVNETWTPVWGEQSKIVNAYRQLTVILVQPKTQRTMSVYFRVFNDGLGFRYEWNEQKKLHKFTLADEVTEFNLGEDYKAFCIPGDYDNNEFPYTTAPLSKIREELPKQSNMGYQNKAKGDLIVQPPLMLKGNNGLYVNIHEASLGDFPAMVLPVDDKNFFLMAESFPDRNGVRGYFQAPARSPWRTIVVSDDARDILASNLILNLNEPCAYDDTSWIHPVKYVGVWWEMFTGLPRGWNYSNYFSAKPGVTDYTKLKPNCRHAANTENVKRYIDFASEHGFDAVLVEGWNEGWEDWAAFTKNVHFSFTRPYPDFDIDELQRYAAAKGVRVMMHHETASNAADYERHLDEAFQYMVDHGYNAVKTGYVGDIIPRSEYHSSQWMNNHYIHVAKRAADYKIMVNSHEAVRPTGLCRTYPNWLAQESARGTEFESFGGLRPAHTAILPFTRLMGGPMDFTPGLFQMDFTYYNKEKKSQVHSTIARQLALYVTMYSPLQMAADLPENYERFMDAFQFIKDVAVDWDESVYLEAEPGDYITVARKAKGTGNWFVGNTSDENGHESKLKLDFLDKNKKYVATIYADAKDASWEHNPQAYTITKGIVTSRTELKLKAASGGGYAISIMEAPDKESLKGLKKL